LPQNLILLVANEFFDALPIRQFVRSEEGWLERMIILNQTGDLCFSSAGEIRETCEPAINIMRSLAKHIKTHKGAGIIIDYGYVGGSAGDTLQAMKNHKYHDVLADVGEADITAHVDFSALAEAARAEGIIAEEAIPQGAFLMRNGAGERTTNLCAISAPEQQKTLISGLKRLADPEEMGKLFKVLIIKSN
jgi:SAM-dependent MidA family methyltransferase